jgi:hypothetical protein
MALNPFFLQGSPGEQRLVQDLINEQLRMYGVDIYYMPREYLGTKTVIKENVLAKFEDNFIIEAYVQNYEGFQGSGDLMTKFGIRTTDELTLVISKERFEDFISPFSMDLLATRPKEGDLIYFPLSDSLFEIKFVEHENPFYQLGKLYMYQLTCELFEYEDEVIDTSIEEIDDNAQNIGYIATLTLAGIGQTAEVSTTLVDGSVNQIVLINDGYGYTSPPAVSISTSPNGSSTANATAVAITTSNTGSGSTTFSVKEVQITNPGFGYTQPPTIVFSGAGGSGASARAGIGTKGVVKILNINTPGAQYATPPVVSISTSPTGLSTANATGVAVVSAGGTIAQIRFTNAGFGYTLAPTITIAPPSAGGSGVGTGNFVINEVITGESSLSTARVKSWDKDTRILKISNLAGTFALGEIIVGSATTFSTPGIGTTARYAVKSIQYDDQYDTYAENIIIENEADGGIVDFTETNPFGTF